MKKTPRGEPGIGVVPDKNLRPNAREPLTERGPLCYVDTPAQIHQFGVKDVRTGEASASFVQSIPKTFPQAEGFREAIIQPSIGGQSATHSRPKISDETARSSKRPQR